MSIIGDAEVPISVRLTSNASVISGDVVADQTISLYTNIVKSGAISERYCSFESVQLDEILIIGEKLCISLYVRETPITEYGEVSFNMGGEHYVVPLRLILNEAKTIQFVVMSGTDELFGQEEPMGVDLSVNWAAFPTADKLIITAPDELTFTAFYCEGPGIDEQSFEGDTAQILTSSGMSEKIWPCAYTLSGGTSATITIRFRNP